MPSIPDMIRDGRGQFSSAALLRNHVEGTGSIVGSNEILAAADRIEALEAICRTTLGVLEGAGMAEGVTAGRIREAIRTETDRE